MKFLFIAVIIMFVGCAKVEDTKENITSTSDVIERVTKIDVKKAPPVDSKVTKDATKVEKKATVTKIDGKKVKGKKPLKK